MIGLTGKERYKEAYKKIKEELSHCHDSTEHKSISEFTRTTYGIEEPQAEVFKSGICNELKIPCKRRVWDKNEKGFWNGVIKGIDDFWLDKKCLEIKGQEDSCGYLDILQKSIAA